MSEGIDWIFRPLERGWCRYESYLDGTLHIADVALMCDAIDVLEENQMRVEKMMAERSRRGDG
jgi:hypothetical protein